MLIRMDHGNTQIKTAHCEPYISGLIERDVRPFAADMLQFWDKLYQITDQRVSCRRGKTGDVTISLF